MSPDSIEFSVLIILVAVAAGVFLYSSYWAFSIRNALVGFIYRRQALWVAIVGVYFAAFFVFAGLTISFGTGNSNSYVTIATDVFIFFAFIVLFAWIDATMRVARRSDPLHRNTLRWHGLRYFIIIGTSFGVGGAIFNSAFNPQIPGNPVVGGFFLLAPVGFALFLGGIALLVSSRRSKDAILTRHLKWLGAFIFFLFVTNEVEREIISRPGLLGNTALLGIITYALFAIGAYLLYRSARSLTPLSPYPSEGSIASPLDSARIDST